MAGKCVKCGKYVCSADAKLKGDKVYCPEHAGVCFIATAAYGSPMVTELDTLRGFRDTRLEPNRVGRKLVRLYYTLSPPVASIISRSEGMRALVRLNLDPVIRALKSKNY